MKPSQESFSLVEGPVGIGGFELARVLGWAGTHFLQQLHFFLKNQTLTGYIDKQGDKWIWNSYEAWAEMLAHTKSEIEDGIKQLLELNLIVRKKCQAWRCNQTPHYRINYAVLWEYLQKIGLKPNKDAWPLFEGIEESESEGSKPPKKPFQYKDFFRRFTSKNKQQAPPPADAVAFKNRSAGENVLEDPPDSQASADNPEKQDPEFHSENGLEDPGGTSPPPATQPLPDVDQARLTEVLRRMADIEINSKTALDLVAKHGLNAVENQLNWLPFRVIKTTEARFVIGALRGNYEIPKELAQAEKSKQSPENQSALRNFLDRLVPQETAFSSPLGTVYRFLRCVSDATLWVRGEQGEQALPTEIAMKWGFA